MHAERPTERQWCWGPRVSSVGCSIWSAAVFLLALVLLQLGGALCSWGGNMSRATNNNLHCKTMYGVSM